MKLRVYKKKRKRRSRHAPETKVIRPLARKCIPGLYYGAACHSRLSSVNTVTPRRWLILWQVLLTWVTFRTHRWKKRTVYISAISTADNTIANEYRWSVHNLFGGAKNIIFPCELVADLIAISNYWRICILMRKQRANRGRLFSRDPSKDSFFPFCNINFTRNYLLKFVSRSPFHIVISANYSRNAFERCINYGITTFIQMYFGLIKYIIKQFCTFLNNGDEHIIFIYA